jgi:disulfide bond formation protein DsbB
VNTLGDNLKKWLKGNIFSMTVVMILTAIGLAIVGVPMWLVLAIITGILNFIPNFGPLIAMILAVLVSFMQGPTTATIVAGMYIVIQVVESIYHSNGTTKVGKHPSCTYHLCSTTNQSFNWWMVAGISYSPNANYDISTRVIY